MSEDTTNYSEYGINCLDDLDGMALDGNPHAAFQAWWLRIGSRIHTPVRRDDNVRWMWYRELCLIAWTDSCMDLRAFFNWYSSNNPFADYFHGMDSIRNLVEKAYVAGFNNDLAKAQPTETK